jgi:hypothetical protein
MPLEIGGRTVVVSLWWSRPRDRQAAWNQRSARDGFGFPLPLKIAVDDDDLVRR